MDVDANVRVFGLRSAPLSHRQYTATRHVLELATSPEHGAGTGYNNLGALKTSQEQGTCCMLL